MSTKILVSFFSLFFFLLVACEEEDNTPQNQITSEEFSEGVFYSLYESGINIEIETNNPATFSPVSGRNTIDISETGSATGDYPPDLYWVNVLWENGQEELLPIVITTHPEDAKNTVQALFEMHTNAENYVLVLRHANADVGEDMSGSDIPEWWKSCDPQIARQVGERGQVRSKLMGDAFNEAGIPVALGISSEFCRAKQTLEFMELDFPTLIDGRLNHSNYNISTKSAYENMEDIVSETPQGDGLLIIVGHSNLKDNNPYLDSIHPFNMSDGFLMKREGDQLNFIGNLPFEYWRLLLRFD